MRDVRGVRGALEIRQPYVARTGLGNEWVLAGDRLEGP